MSDFAVQLPAMVIMDMMGVPRDMLFTIKAWSDDLINFVGSPRSVDDKYERARGGVVAMAEYFGRLIAERRAEPKNDILTMLIEARDDQSMLTDDEVVASAMLLLFAGHETTTNLLGNALMALHTNPDQQNRLRQDPGLIDTAVEEFLRFDGPVLSVSRAVARPHELGGKALEEGNRVFVMITAANRDPAVFADPDRVDLARMPNRHMTFGKGIHFCLGASLARLETKTAQRDSPSLSVDRTDSPYRGPRLDRRHGHARRALPAGPLRPITIPPKSKPARLSASGRRRADCFELFRRHQHTPGSPNARGLVRRGSRQGHGEPDLAAR
jgi:cytochrome P450